MTAAVSALYEPLIERDVARIPAAVRHFRREHSSDDLFAAIGRFSILSYAPSQHARHAMLASLAAYEMKDELGERWDEALIECAKYTAMSRQPWSEPPILEPPAFDANDPCDITELRNAVAEHDRLRAERWLARRIDDPDLADDYFLVASDDFEDLGHKLIVATAAWKLADLLGEKGRYAALRIGVWEMVAYDGPPALTGPGIDAAELLNGLIRCCVDGQGSIERAHAVFLFDSAVQALEITRESMIYDRAAAHLADARGGKTPSSVRTGEGACPPPVYAFGRDYAQYLKACAVAKRLRSRFPDAPVGAFVAAAKYNLDHAPSFEEWSFA